MTASRERAVAVHIDDGVARLTLAPGRRDVAVAQALDAACRDIALDAAVHVVVVQGAGADISLDVPDGRPSGPSWPDPVAAVAALPQPVLAAIDGEARGLGFALALACDVRIASTRASFRVSEVAEGRVPAGGLTQRLPRIVGTSRAMTLVLLGERLRAIDALAWGLVAEVVPHDRLSRVTAARARTLAARGPIALRYAKEAVRRALDLPLDDGVRLEHDLYVLLQTTADRREGVEAFRRRRRPRFQAR